MVEPLNHRFDGYRTEYFRVESLAALRNAIDRDFPKASCTAMYAPRKVLSISNGGHSGTPGKSKTTWIVVGFQQAKIKFALLVRELLPDPTS